jgi:hypothetical protein
MSHLCKVRGSGPNARQQTAQVAPAVSFDSGPVETGLVAPRWRRRQGLDSAVEAVVAHPP